MIIGLALAPALDVTYEVDALAPGGITRPHAVTRVAGGKTLNMIRVAAALGGDAAAVAALGGPSGAWIEQLLRAEGVPVEVVATAEATRTCIAIVEAAGGATSTDLYEAATPLAAPEWEAFAAAAVRASVRAAEHGAKARFALSGSVPMGVATDAVPTLLGALRDAGHPIAVDGSGEGLAATIGVADLVKINLGEARELLGADIPYAAAACIAIADRWGCDAVVTDGVRGGAGILRGQAVRFAAPSTTGRFPAGSGDAFFGGLLVALNAGADAEHAVDAGRRAAERNAAVPGQGILAP